MFHIMSLEFNFFFLVVVFVACACWLLFVTLLCSHTVNCHFIDIYYFFLVAFFGSVGIFLCVCVCVVSVLLKCLVNQMRTSKYSIKVSHYTGFFYHRNFFFVLVTELFHNVIQQYPSKNQNNQKEMRFSLAFFVVAKP